MNRLEDKIKNSDVVSFDLFDTLIFRMVKDKYDIYDIVGERFKIDDFRRIRINAEIRATKKNGGFAGLYLKDIYEELENIDNYDQIMNYELKVEKSLIYPNMPMKDYLDYAKVLNKRIIICSDTYFSLKFIEDILGQYNIEYDELYLSSKEEMSKSDKSIFTKYCNQKVLHIGDNLFSDYLNALDAGISAFHYKKDKLKDKNYYYNFGYNRFGPLFSGYYQFVEKEIMESNAETILFVARDSYLLNKIFSENNHDFNNVYAKLSRMILSLCYTEDIEKFVDYISSNDGFTMREFSEIYDVKLDTENLECEIQKNKGELIQLLQTSNEFAIKSKLNKHEVLKYLINICNLDADILIVDTGWNGSTQYYLEKLLADLNYSYQIKGLYFGIMNFEKIFNGDYSCFSFDNIQGKGKDFEWLNSIAILETILSAPHSTLKDVNEEINDNYLEYPNLNEIHRGIKDFMEDKYLDIKEFTGIDYCGNYLNVIKHPQMQDVKYLGSLMQSDSIADNRLKRIINTDDFKKNLKELDFQKLITDTFWPSGQVKALCGVNIFDNLIQLMIKKYAGRKK